MILLFELAGKRDADVSFFSLLEKNSDFLIWV